MTATAELGPVTPAPTQSAPDHRGSPIPTWGLISTRFLDLRKRRGLMIALIVVNIGIPTVVLGVRMIAHLVNPSTYGPAGGYDTFTHLVAGIMFVFGFIVAATLGATAGSSDLSEGVFRHLVVTGRSRLAIYLARIPAGLMIVVPLVAIGYTIVCLVCVFAAPTSLNYQGSTVPANMSLSQMQTWASQHQNVVLCNFPYDQPINIGCTGDPNNPTIGEGIPAGTVIHKRGNGKDIAVVVPAPPTAAQQTVLAQQIATNDYPDYQRFFRTPPLPLMLKTGLWLELEAAIGLIVGLGLASLIGQRTVTVVLMVVLELILTPLLSSNVIPHFINLQRGMVGLAMAHLEPGHLPGPFGGGGGPGDASLVPESITASVLVVIGWLLVWTVLGAWRMMTRDA